MRWRNVVGVAGALGVAAAAGRPIEGGGLGRGDGLGGSCFGFVPVAEEVLVCVFT